MDFVFSGLAATGGGGASGSSGSSSSSGVVGGDGSGFLVGWNQQHKWISDFKNDTFKFFQESL